MSPRRASRMDSRRHVAGMLACALILVMALALALTGGTAHAAAAAAGPAANAAVEFDPGMLSGVSRRSIDLSRFEKGIDVLPGHYNVDVYLNKQWVGRMNVRFAAPGPDTDAVPCLDPELVERLQLQAQIAATGTRPAPTGACSQLDKLVPGARMTFDMSNLRLGVSVPQALLGEKPRGYVDPSSWDAGVPAFMLNYRLNTYHGRSRGLDQTSAYLGLDAGLNIGLWHLRQNATATWFSGQQGMPAQRRWHNIDAYAQRSLPMLKANLTLGDSHTDGAVFDSFAMRGVQLATDDRMYPQSRRGYAPVVRGVAETNAKVVIRQNGVQIYQTTVPPGPFVINDLYPTGYGGSLEVTVTEADGRRHTYAVPYASVAQLVRPGVTRFDVAAGQLRNLPLGEHPRVVQGTIQHGFNNFLTGYAGFQGSSGYAAALIGAAINTRFGALALDITEAGTTLPGQAAHTGQSVRATWSKVLPDTRTAVSVAAYRYSTAGFLDLTDAAIARAWARHGLDTFQHQPTNIPSINGVPVQGPLTPAQQAALSSQQAGAADTWQQPRGLLHQRNRFTLSLSQPLGANGGSLYANVSFRDYWNRGSRDTLFQLGYNNHFQRLGYSISAARTRDLFGRFDNRVSLNFSLPLGDTPSAPNLMVNLDHDSQGRSQQQAMLNGSLGRYNQFNWGASVSHGSDGAGNAASVNAGYRGSHAVFNASYGKGEGYSQASFGMSGSLVAHAGGITFGQPTGDTVALVHAPGAAGAHVQNAPGVTLDANGYAVVPYLTPYQLDTVRIDPRGLPLGVQLETTSTNVAPYAGAVVMANFKTRYGRPLIARIRQADGTPLPFGTEVHDAAGQSVGTVGQAGIALLRVGSQQGRLDASWKDAQESSHACRFDYTVPAVVTRPSAHTAIDVICHAHAPASTAEQG